MRRVRSAVFALLPLAAAPAAAGGWYVQAFVGANFADDIEFDVDAGAIETSLDDGYVWSIGGGYRFKRFRLDAELDTPRETDVDVHRLNGVEQGGSRGDVQSEAGMGNIVYDFNKDKRVSPYVGAGIGWAEIELTDFGTDENPEIVTAEDTLFAWQFLAGVGIDVDEHWIVDFSLRYYATEYGTFEPAPAVGAQRVEVDYSSFSFTAGFRYNF